jgi:hypothetical protein
VRPVAIVRLTLPPATGAMVALVAAFVKFVTVAIYLGTHVLTVVKPRVGSWKLFRTIIELA